MHQRYRNGGYTLALRSVTRREGGVKNWQKHCHVTIEWSLSIHPSWFLFYSVLDLRRLYHLESFLSRWTKTNICSWMLRKFDFTQNLIKVERWFSIDSGQTQWLLKELIRRGRKDRWSNRFSQLFIWKEHWTSLRHMLK